MKKIISLLILFTLSISLNSCLENFKNPENLSLEEDFQLVEVNDLYSMKVPNYMDEETSLNEEASLIYVNEYKEAYVLVIDENLKEFEEVQDYFEDYDESLGILSNYRNVQLEGIKEEMTNITQGEVSKYKINGLNAESVLIEGLSDDVDAAFYFTFIEGKEDLFMIMSWTLKDRKNAFIGTFEQMANSFKLIKK